MTARECIIPVFVPHLGCPNDCVFCNQRRISGSQNPATADDVRKAVELGIELTAGRADRQIAFYGGSFTAIPVEQQIELLEAARPYILNGEVESLRLSTRPDAVDGAVLKRLKSYGVKTIEIGAQSMDEDVLALSGRGHTVQDVVNAAEIIKENGFRLILQMMTGLPGDTAEKAMATAEKIISLKPDGVRIYPTVIVRDTALFDLWQNGQYEEHTVEQAVSICALLYKMFSDACIPIIRMGLNPTDELSGGAAAGGAFHPALGELVQSRIFRNRVESELRSIGVHDSRKIVINVCPKDVSKMTGQHRSNISWLMSTFGIQNINVKPDISVKKDEFRLEIS